MNTRTLLTIDAAINFALGILLLVFPKSLVFALGVPDTTSAFYPSILGAVLTGIAIALLVERFRGADGLGLPGAFTINLCGGIVLAGWLLFGDLDLPMRGLIFLWSLVIVLVGISSVEWIAWASKGKAK